MLTTATTASYAAEQDSGGDGSGGYGDGSVRESERKNAGAHREPVGEQSVRGEGLTSPESSPEFGGAEEEEEGVDGDVTV